MLTDDPPPVTVSVRRVVEAAEWAWYWGCLAALGIGIGTTCARLGVSPWIAGLAFGWIPAVLVPRPDVDGS